ncbi:MAG: DinB family protein [Planctomycetes bacterium]|nr:DinB family protein [Planctomycetota bacterium]
MNPRIVVPIHYKTPSLVYDLQGVQGFLNAIRDDCQVERTQGNTLAVSAAKRGTAKPQAIVLDFVPLTLPKEWEELFAAKEKACRDSQHVFAKLSVSQLNFKPSNGTHTPRWNAEHMMGRELGFFSQIYAKLNIDIRHSDLNPKQMPPDYVAAHPDWTGAEEARQMERVSAFTRRYAYLLDGMELDQQAPDSRWTPRALLRQMARHYHEHTANVKKKFELPDWPAE